MNSPSIASLPNNQIILNKPMPFEEFLENFKNKLKNVFNDSGKAEHLSNKRGLQPEMIKEIMSSNPLSVGIPVAFGGRGGYMHENLELLTTTAYESLALSLTMGINSALFLQPVAKYADDKIKASIFNRFLNDQAMGGLMITEPNHGSDALSMQTNYTEQSDHYHIQGKKHWGGLTGYADYWLVTARHLSHNGDLMRDIDFFICDISDKSQKIVVEEYFENLGLYLIPYGRNHIDIRVPKYHRLQPKNESTGVHMMLDILHRSRMHFPGMGLGFVKRMMDEAILHCNSRFVGKKSLLGYDQVQNRLARHQASFTICSALCFVSSELADSNSDLVSHGMEANIIKTVTADLMQESSQSLLQLVGAKGYRLNHVAGRAVVDCRPFQIFEGSNDMLYSQISESFLKIMKINKETNFLKFLKSFKLTSRSTEYLKELVNFEVYMQMSQRKLVEFGNVISRIVTMDYVLKMGDQGFHADLISGALTILKQEITHMLSTYASDNSVVVVQAYQENSSWHKFVK